MRTTEVFGEVTHNIKAGSVNEKAKFLSPVRTIEYLESMGIEMSISTLYKLTMSKKIPFSRFGGRKIVFDSMELDSWIESRLERRGENNPITSNVAQEARNKKL